jgi:hypothetical protein
LKPEELAERSAAKVIGRFDNGLPFLVERRIDRGLVMFCSTPLQSAPLTQVRAVVVLDRLLRDLLGGTLPRRNFDTTEPILLPMRPPGSGTYLQLVHPGDRTEAVAVDALGEDKYALVLRNVVERGVYRVVARQAEADASGQAVERVVAEMPLAVNGPELESQLTPVEQAAAMTGVDAARVRWLARDESIRVEGATVSGRNLWKWLMAFVLGGLILELAILRWMRPTAKLSLSTAGVGAASPTAPIGGSA